MKPVLVAYEESGIITSALRDRGIEAYSNDIQDTRGNPDWHIKGDAMEVIFSREWGGIICHKVCTYLANSGAKHLYNDCKKENGINLERWEKMLFDAKEFRYVLDNAPTKFLAMENPIIHCHAKAIIGPQTQCVQPWWFGTKEIKATCWWLRGLPSLVKTNDVGPVPKDVAERRKWAKVHQCPPGPLRQRIRSETDRNHAEAIADQWSEYFKGTK